MPFQVTTGDSPVWPFASLKKKASNSFRAFQSYYSWFSWNTRVCWQECPALVSLMFCSLSVCLCLKFAVLVGSLCTNLWWIPLQRLAPWAKCWHWYWYPAVSLGCLKLRLIFVILFTHATVLVSASQGHFEQVITAEPAPVVTYLCYNVSKFKIEF